MFMRIASSSINMSSQHSLEEQDVQSESLKVWGDVKTANIANSSPENGNTGQQVLVEISAAAKELYTQTQQTISVDKLDSHFFLKDEDKQKLMLIQALMESLTGKKFKFYLPTLDGETQPEVKIKLSQSAIDRLNAARQPQQRQGWGLEYHSYQGHFESESVAFQAAGVVKTTDGKEIDISMALKMTRQFASEQRIDVKAGDALIDPLVINFDAPAAKLTQTKFSFDLDSDGTADQISFAAPGSGFLALDLNNDGKINNGKELFGPNTGNGFSELSQYDSDNNGWIDENDSIYDKLRIWTKDAQGNDQLFALGQKGIGAICLGNVTTDFALKDNQNTQQGQLRTTGLFLRENGTAGTVQQVDLAI